jgi:hypothetical protein
MSRRQNRKKRRNQERRDRLRDNSTASLYEPIDPTALMAMDDDDFPWFRHREQPVAKACGSCHEFIEDQEVGRGTCLHPASGVFAPWYDTPACPYYRRS